MLRLAACLATEQGVEVCALIHDAVLIAAPLDRLDHDIERMRAAMAKASRVVLDGFELRTDVNIIRYPDRYQDPRGVEMWARVMELWPSARRQNRRRSHDGRSDDIDIEKLRVDPENLCSRPSSRSTRNGGEFSPWCRGPGSFGCSMRSVSAPTSWPSSFSTSTGSTRASRLPSPTKWRPRPSLSARSKSRALAELEQLGVITVDRGMRRSPRATLLLVPKG